MITTKKILPVKSNKLPHLKVYTRIKPSKVHGVGVFAIQLIKKGTYIFFGDNEKMAWVKDTQIKKLPRALIKLYEDFCVIKKDKNGKFYLCPRNFNVLTVAWYINNSDDPNVGCDKNFDFFALRNIRTGEELTANYSTYSDEN
jgi:SET domain-containing protein